MSSSLGIECPPTPDHLELPPTPDRNDVQDLNSPSQASDPEPSEERASSPPPNCAICLGQCRNKSFTDSCLHQFCFKCLLEWSKVKAECPLCKQAFKSIIHNVRSIDQFDEHMVHPQQSILQRLDFLLSEPPRFRFSATLQVGPSENEAIQRFFAPTEFHRRFMQPYRFRQLVYANNLYAEPLTDITGRYRESSARFYRDNTAQVHRLMPFISRETRSLLASEEEASSACSQILVLLTLHDITSPGFRSRVRHFFNENTDHFIHELHNFAQAPYDLVGYDHHVRYVNRNGTASNVNVNITPPSFETDDIARMAVPPGEIAPPPPSSGQPSTTTARDPRNSLIFQMGRNIEIISTSEDESDDCQFVLELKPPHLRTPELVSLNSESDSDVIFVDESQKSPKPQMVSEQVPGPSTDTPAPSTSTVRLPQIPKLRIKAVNSIQARIVNSDDTDEEVKPSTSASTAAAAAAHQLRDGAGSSSGSSEFLSSTRKKILRLRGKRISQSSSNNSSNTSSVDSSTDSSSSSGSNNPPSRVVPPKKRRYTMSSTSTSADSSSPDESSHEEFAVSMKVGKKFRRLSHGQRNRQSRRLESSDDEETPISRRQPKMNKRSKTERRVYKRITKNRKDTKVSAETAEK